MLHEMASQALSIPEILSVVSSNGTEMEGGKASCAASRRPICGGVASWDFYMLQNGQSVFDCRLRLPKLF